MKPVFRASVLVLVVCAVTLGHTERKLSFRPFRQTSRDQSQSAPAPVKTVNEDATEKPSADPRLDRAQLLIHQVASDALHLEQKDEAARILAKAGELLWTREPDVSRRSFEQAFDMAAEFDRDKPEGSQIVFGGSRVNRGGARQEVLRTVARYDEKLAEQFIKQIKDEPKEHSPAKPGDDPFSSGASASSSAYLSAANAMLDSNPSKAAELAGMALKDGVPLGIASFLFNLGKKSEAAADDVYRLALARARSLPFGVPSVAAASLLAAYPFGDLRVTYSDGASTMVMGFAQQGEKSPAPNPALQIEYLNFAYGLLTAPLPDAPPADSAEANQRDQAYGAMVSLARSLAPKFAKVQPERAAAVDERARFLTSQLGDERRRNFNDRGIPFGADTSAQGNDDDPVQRALDKADAAGDPDQRAQFLMTAAMAALNKKEFDRAREIANRVNDPDGRNELLTYINFDAAQGASSRGELDEARHLAAAIPKLEQRAFVLSQIAEKSIKQEDRPRTVELLDETERLAMKADDSAEKAFALVRIVNLYGQIDMIRAFEVLSEAIDAINKVKDFSIERPLIRRIHLKNWRMITSAISVGSANFESTLSRMAGEDFDRALLLAQKLRQPNLNATAVLAVAKAILMPEKKSEGSSS